MTIESRIFQVFAACGLRRTVCRCRRDLVDSVASLFSLALRATTIHPHPAHSATISAGLLSVQWKSTARQPAYELLDFQRGGRFRNDVHPHS